MSLILQDPEKYLEMMELFAKEEKEMQITSLRRIRESSDGDVLAGLKLVGAILTNVRINKGYTLKKFVMEQFTGEEGIASMISNVERGLDIPSPVIIQKYLNLLKEENNSVI